MERYYKNIVTSLELLSLKFEEQQKEFPEFVDVPFEVLDTFHNALLHLPKLIEENRFENHVIASLLRLQNIINFTASNPKFKDLEEEQFKVSDEWNKVRRMAKETLQIMGEYPATPSNGWK